MADLFDKEELSVVGSLFGTSPEGLQLAREQLVAKAGQSAGTNLLGGILGQANVFAERGATGLRQALGQQDPQERIAALRQQAAQQFDPNSPDGLAQIAQFLNQNGDSAGARQAVMLAQGQAQKTAALGKTVEETRILGRKEIEIGVDPKNPEMVQKALVDKDGNVLRLLGEPYSKFNQKTNISVDARGETEFSKQLGKNDANTVTSAMTTREGAVNTLNSLRKLQSLNQNELIGGSFANGRVGAANFLNTIGLATEKDMSRLATSQVFDKTSKDVILQSLGGKLGTAISDADREFIAKTAPQLETSPLARKQLIDFMIDKNLNVVKETTRLEGYARKNRSLEGFDYVIPRESLAPSLKTTTGYNIVDLQAEAKRRNLNVKD
jgi:hypothetical protein